MRFLAAGCLALLALVLAGCALPKAPDGAETVADTAYSQLRAGDVAALQASGTAEMQGPVVASQIAKLRALLPAGPPTASRTVSWDVNFAGNGAARAEVIREYDYPGRTVQWTAVLQRDTKSAPWKIYGCHAQVATDEQLSAAGLTLQNRSPLHYAVLSAAILAPLFCLVALFQVIRAPKFPWKWAFAVLCLVGFTRLSLNWQTGEAAFQPINVTLLAAGFIKIGGKFAPLIISVSPPIGAMIGLWRAGKARRDLAKANRAAFQ